MAVPGNMELRRGHRTARQRTEGRVSVRSSRQSAAHPRCTSPVPTSNTENNTGCRRDLQRRHQPRAPHSTGGPEMAPRWGSVMEEAHTHAYTHAHHHMHTHEGALPRLPRVESRAGEGGVLPCRSCVGFGLSWCTELRMCRLTC